MFYLQMIEFTFFSWTLILFLMLMHSTLRPTSPLFWPLLNRMCHKTTSHVKIWAVTFFVFLSFFSVYFMFCLFACANDVFPFLLLFLSYFPFCMFFFLLRSMRENCTKIKIVWIDFMHIWIKKFLVGLILLLLCF